MMTNEQMALLVTVAGLAIMAASFVWGYRAARKAEKRLGASRIPLVTSTVALDLAGVATTLVLAAVALNLLWKEPLDSSNWTVPVLFFVLASLNSFPTGLVFRPGLTTEGLVYLGTLYRWDYFTTYSMVRADKIRLYYRRPWLGLRWLAVRVDVADTERFTARLREAGVSLAEA